MSKKLFHNLTLIAIASLFVFGLLATVVWAASSSNSSLNVSLSVTCTSSGCSSGGGGGGGGEPPPPPPPEEGIPGCMDPLATNYNSLATVPDISCQYQQTVPNVTNFQADFNLEAQNIALHWNNPSFPQLVSVRIVRSTVSVPISPSDGVVVYEGLGTSFIDLGLELRIRYYYTAFVKSSTGTYSSGAVTSAIGVTTPEEEPPVIPPDLITLPPGAVEPSPFEALPKAVTNDPVLQKIAIGDFQLRQSGEITKYFSSGAVVAVNGNKDLTLAIDASAFPKVLKTIGVVVSDPVVKSRSFSFIMQASEDGQTYTATLGSFKRNGSFPISIYIINYKDQTIRKIEGRLAVAGVAMLAPSLLTEKLTATAGSVAAAAGLAAGVSQFAFLGMNITSVYDVYLILARLLYSVLSWLGIKRKNPEWGTVYDAVTKQPIDPAYVTVTNVAGKEVTSSITDIDGRFGFLLPKDVYYFTVGKTNYKFPSTTLKDKDHDELYSNLYFGGPLAHDGNQIIKLNVPLDPVGFDWNEFAKSKIDFFKLYSKKETLRRRLLASVFYAGFAISASKFLVAPSYLDLGIVIFYFGVLAYQRFYASRHKIVSVKRGTEPLPFAIVRLFLPGIDQAIKTVTTDALGRLYALVRPGTYYLTVEEKLADGTYQKVKQTEPMLLSKGVLDQDLLV